MERRTPFVIFTASGGARMQEGMFALMQMARTTVAVRRLRAAKLPYIVVLANPTTGGVTASYAMLGDIHIAEPGAVIGFAGARRDRADNSRAPAGGLSARGVLTSSWNGRSCRAAATAARDPRPSLPAAFPRPDCAGGMKAAISRIVSGVLGRRLDQMKSRSSTVKNAAFGGRGGSVSVKRCFGRGWERRGRRRGSP